MAKRGSGPDFIEALARGLEVIQALGDATTRKVLLAGLGQEELDAVLAQPSRSGVVARREVDRAELDRELADTRAKGWCMTDQDLAVGIRSVAAPLRDATGRVVAALNVNAHAGQTSVDRLLEHHLLRLLYGIRDQ
ncbi:IclR family transcriptional regulator domain-containing protein [Calidifontibacter indicus]|uniref:IclR family transcriptional regulator domain-containing protein n=1 Tax=Calidifontibacter indicus TaxID=419650 RepID=UPI003D759D26